MKEKQTPAVDDVTATQDEIRKALGNIDGWIDRLMSCHVRAGHDVAAALVLLARQKFADAWQRYVSDADTVGHRRELGAFEEDKPPATEPAKPAKAGPARAPEAQCAVTGSRCKYDQLGGTTCACGKVKRGATPPAVPPVDPRQTTIGGEGEAQ